MSGRQSRALADLREVFKKTGNVELDHAHHLVETWCVAGGPNDAGRRVALVLAIARDVCPPDGRLPEDATSHDVKGRLLAVLGAMNGDVMSRKISGSRRV